MTKKKKKKKKNWKGKKHGNPVRDSDSVGINRMLDRLNQYIVDGKKGLIKKEKYKLKNYYKVRGWGKIDPNQLLISHLESKQSQQNRDEDYEMVYDGYSGDMIWVHPETPEASQYGYQFNSETAVKSKNISINNSEKFTHGNPGERKLFIDLTLTNTKRGNNFYGKYTYYLWSDSSGQKFKWFYNNNHVNEKIGTVMDVKGTIKEYAKFHEDIYIVLLRCIILKKNGVAIIPQKTQKSKKTQQRNGSSTHKFHFVPTMNSPTLCGLAVETSAQKTGIKGVTCKNCIKSFNSKNPTIIEPIKAEKTHTERKSKSQLSNIHAESEERTIPCINCDRFFASDIALGSHREAKHDKKKTSLKAKRKGKKKKKSNKKNNVKKKPKKK